MMPRCHSADGSKTVTVRVPIVMRKRGGRKLVITPDGASMAPDRTGSQVNNAMVKALARAFRWREMLEKGDYATIREISRAEKINESYICRLLRLTLLAPDIVEVIVRGEQPAGLQLDTLTKRFAPSWAAQAELFSS